MSGYDFQAGAGDAPKPRVKDVFAPLRGKVKKRRWVVFDIESKKLDTTEKGFERPFLACFYDGDEYESFRNDERHAGRSYETRFFLEPGGCIDRMMRHILGLRACEKCEIVEGQNKWGSCKACTRARRRYQAKKFLITAHNGGNFDNLFVLGWIRLHAELFCGQEIVNVQSRMLILTFKPRMNDAANAGKEKWSFTDSIAILPLALKEIGKTFCSDNPDVQKMNFDLNLPEDDPRWDEYNERDCLVLLVALNGFRSLVTDKLGGAVGMTAASTAMSVFRRKFLRKPIERNSHFPECDGKCHKEMCEIDECRARAPEERECHGCMHDFVREAFFGGRTEVIRMSGWDLTYMDINSSYPTAMLGDLPTGKSRVLREGATLSMLRSMARTYQGFVECIIEVPKKMYLPPLPYRWHKRSGEMKLIFPTGRLYGTWTWLEIDYALSLGCKMLVVGKSVWFQKGKLFDKMIEVLYRFRQKKCANPGCGKNVQEGKCKCAKKTWEPGMDFVAKLMMNSSFGKLATNPIREKTLLTDMIPFDKPGTKIPPSWMKDAPMKAQHIITADYIIPHIPAWITSDARVRLHKGMQGVLNKGGQVSYGDSVSADRCVVVQSPDGLTKVLPVAALYSMAPTKTTRMDGKEVGLYEGWKALARDRSGRDGWFKLQGVVRHAAGKPMHLVSTKEGQTEVTSDHGIMVERGPVSPSEFVASGDAFTRVPVPVSPVMSEVDLMAEVAGARIRAGSQGRGVGLKWSELYDDGGLIRLGDYDGGMRRRYRSGSKEIHALLRVVGAFVAEGSASIHREMEIAHRPVEGKRAVRSMWSVAQQDAPWLAAIKRDVESITEGVHIGGPMETTGAHVLRSGALFMPFMFAVMCGEGGSARRRLPNFCMNLSREDFMVLWEKLVEGDGSIDESGGAQLYTTQSLELASQLSMALRSYGIDVSIRYRADKACWTIRTRAGSPRRSRGTKHEVREPREGEYVYDLNVPDAGTFVDALGGVLVHNTDSCLSSHRLSPEGTALGEWKVEEKKFSYDGILPKMYMLCLHTDDCKDHACRGCRVMHKKTVPDTNLCAEDEMCVGCKSPQKVAMKGIPRDSQKGEVYELLKGGGEVHFSRLSKFRTMLVKTLLSPVEEPAHRAIRSMYDKRSILPNGDTRPLFLQDPMTLGEARSLRSRLIRSCPSVGA